MTARAYHGTDCLDFTRFDIAAAGMFNIGLFRQYFHRNSSAAKPPVHHSSLITHPSYFSRIRAELASTLFISFYG